MFKIFKIILFVLLSFLLPLQLIHLAQFRWEPVVIL